ncbi:hypothetical protein HDU96_006900 [Phlyctochytrium bullatum]|nr:hypothetical protein HDU96_006900 [Phlyctochytrium bullatum]
MRAFLSLAVYTLASLLASAAPQQPVTESACNVQTAPWDISYTLSGCYAHETGRSLNSTDDKGLEWKWIAKGKMTVDLCVAHCSFFGYPVAAVGDCDDSIKTEGSVPLSDCAATKCPGNSDMCCGAKNRVLVFNANADLTAKLLPRFETPEIKGRFDFLYSAPGAPITAILTKTNKVLTMDRLPITAADVGNYNSSHSYELDYSFADPSLSFRELHPKTDPFCGGIHMLPDQWGRILLLGGQLGDSLKAIRVYRPTGKIGQNGTTDWEESVGDLHLLKQRWYPTLLQLRNGSYAVVGGSVDSLMIRGENSLEILPESSAVVKLPILQETDGKNLYPFLFMLPSGRIFLLAHNRAVLLDQTNFDLVRELPRVPCSPAGGAGTGVGSDWSATSPGYFLGDGGRTYPNAGASVLLPIQPPYNQHQIEVLVCGGALGFRMKALNSCARIKPDTEEAEWVLERMPSTRVMQNMVALPDFTYLLVNGAHRGLAGYAQADEPNFAAWIYDPSKPSNARFSIHSSTDIPRMYHSGAQLMHDGRVLIFGSDAQDPRFPQERRLEIFTPSYLLNGLARPTYTITNGGVEKHFAHGDSIEVTANIPGGDISKVRASLISPGGNTHYIHMGQRILEATVSKASDAASEGSTAVTLKVGPLPESDLVMPPGNYLLFLLDGPTPSEAQWVRVGQSFPHLDNWPNVSGFTKMPQWTPDA